MPSYSKLSKARLATCHDDLITIFNKVIEHMDVTIVCGHRGKEEQNEYIIASRFMQNIFNIK